MINAFGYIIVPIKNIQEAFNRANKEAEVQAKVECFKREFNHLNTHIGEVNRILEDGKMSIEVKNALIGLKTDMIKASKEIEKDRDIMMGWEDE